MKHIFYIGMLLVSFNLNAQSKKETIDWLNNKFTLSATYEFETSGYKFTYKSTLHIKDDGTFAIKTEDFSLKNTTYSYGNLKDFNPNSAKIYKMGEFFWIQISCTNTKGCVKKEGRFSEDNRTAEGIGFGGFRINAENEFAERMLKAIKHLVTILGGKKEAF